MEKPYNKEGLKNHHLGEGSNFVSTTGEEYLDIFPCWDWQRIPGTTLLQKEELPPIEAVQQKGDSDFVGGVAAGRFALASFDYISVHDDLAGRKSWFLMPDQIVCLGAGLTSSSSNHVITTLDQCHSHDSVLIWSSDEVGSWEHSITQVNEIMGFHHGGKSHLLFEPAELHIENRSRSGSWYDINKQSDTPRDQVTQKVFTAYLDHGSKPLDASYAYVILPNSTVSEDHELPNHKVRILENSTSIQAIENGGDHLVQAAFFEPGRVKTDWLELEATDPLLISIQASTEGTLSLALCDPTHKLNSLRMRVRGSFTCDDSRASTESRHDNSTELEVVMPTGEYAGSTVQLRLNNTQ